MSVAKRCNRCHKFFDLYPYSNGNNGNNRECVNGITVASISDEQKFYNVELLDLCPECLHGLKVWLDTYLDNPDDSYIKTKLNIETEGKCNEVEIEINHPNMKNDKKEDTKDVHK